MKRNFYVTGEYDTPSYLIHFNNNTYTLEAHLKKYEKYMYNRNLSDRTIFTYLYVVNKFYKKYNGQINKTNLLAWKSWMIDIKKYKPASVNLYIISMNQYLKYTHQENLTLRIVKVPHKNFLDNTISLRDYKKLKAKLLEDGKTMLYHIICTFGTTGLRVSELVKLNIGDIKAGQVDIHSKGDRIRRVYFPKTLIRQLSDWLKTEHRYDEADNAPLFINTSGVRVSISGVQAMVARAKKRYKIAGLHCHALRHMFAFTWLDVMSKVKQKNGQRQYGVLPILAEILGHKSLDTVFIYLQPGSAELKAYADEVNW